MDKLQTHAKQTSRSRKRQETREAVLEAATELFSRSGFDGVALDEIATTSGVRKNNLLYHFTSKELLWKEVVDRTFDQVERYFTERRGDLVADSWEGFEAYARSYFEACWRFPAYMLIPMIEGVNESWRTNYLAKQYLGRHVENFRTYVGKLVSNGVLTPINSIYLQNIFTGGAQSFLALAPLWRKAIDVDTHETAFIADYVETLLSLIGAASRNVAASPS